jgi:uncharacterized protein (UPF0212 family)
MTSLTDSIIAGYYQCPICGEIEYIYIMVVATIVVVTICLSCGYDGSMVAFNAIKALPE